jgi:hypothetical protein
MNTSFFQNLFFTADETETWPCPSCVTGRISLDPKSLRATENAWTRAAEATWDEYDHRDSVRHFTCQWHCNNTQCREVVHVTGKTNWTEIGREDENGIPYPEDVEAYMPLFILPALPLFPIPHDLKNEVKNALEAGFSMALADANAAANQLRRAVECLMDQLKVQKWPKKKIQPATKQPAAPQPAKKRKPLFLHSRIEKLPVRYAAIKKHLLAIKWLGNDGSHASGIDRKNMLIGYEIFEHCLEKLYSDKEDQIQKKIEAINKKEGQLRPPTHPILRRLKRQARRAKS